MLESFFSAFVIILAIMDPFAGMPVFVALTRSLTAAKKIESANVAIFAAAIPLVLFTLVGSWILAAFHVSLSSFEIAGGIVLMAMGLQIVFGIALSGERRDLHIAATIIGVPLITGPGVITSVIILANQNGYVVPLVAGLVALFVTWLILRSANAIHKAIGRDGIEILSRVIGILLVGVAVEFIKQGLAAA
jgi:multiple antibiotic resistance protein